MADLLKNNNKIITNNRSCFQSYSASFTRDSSRFEGIVIVRNGGSYGAVSANWSITRTSNDSAPVSDDLLPAEGSVKFAAGQVTTVIPIDIVADDLPEEAEAFLLKLLPGTVTGNAELDEPIEVGLVSVV